MTLTLIPSVERGATLQCGTCPAVATVERKNILPAGWLILVVGRTPAGEVLPRVVCPVCNRAEVERWNPGK